MKENEGNMKNKKEIWTDHKGKWRNSEGNEGNIKKYKGNMKGT